MMFGRRYRALLVVSFSSLLVGSIFLTGMATAANDVSFDRQIVPILTKAGCNAGSCHGAATGRGNFRLSLLGSDPSADYRSIVEAFYGRRVDLHRPSRSLLLRKPTSDLEHGGGQVLDPSGEDTRTILRWIEAGAERQVDPALRHLNVKAPQFRFDSVPGKTTVEAVATFDDGRTLVVTNWVTWTSPDPSAIRVDPSGAVELLRAGQHVLMARYMDQVVALQWTAPLGAALPNDQWKTATNFVDREILERLNELRISPSPLADDAQWLRRVHLDLTGRLPDPAFVREYLGRINDATRATQREEVVDRLLHSPEYTDYWTWRLSKDLRLRSFPNEREPLEAYYRWLRQVIEADEGLDHLVRALLTSDGDSHEVGPANFSRMVRDAREQAELVGQFFAGVRLGCANCHNHPLDCWTQDDYHGLAAVFARVQRGRQVGLGTRGEVTNLRTNEPATPRVPGQRDLVADGDRRHEIVAWVLDSEQNRFARVTVNRLWSAMFGRGLIEPVDDMRVTNPATHPELLDQLADDFAKNGYRLRPTLRRLALSQSYGRSTEVLPDNQLDERFYSRAYPRPLEAAVLVDAIQDVTGVSEEFDGHQVRRAVHVVDAALPASTLDSLGRCPGTAACKSTNGELHLSAQLTLLNGQVINQKLRAPTGRLQTQIQAKLTIPQIVSEWYWVALSRPASTDEQRFWIEALSDDDLEQQNKRVEDFVWSLLNSRAFIER